jgi:hypothetical protein
MRESVENRPEREFSRISGEKQVFGVKIGQKIILGLNLGPKMSGLQTGGGTHTPALIQKGFDPVGSR